MQRVPAFLALFFLAWSVAGVDLVSKPVITLADSGVSITWSTDVACGTRAAFGTSLLKLDQKVEGPVSEQHSVILAPLTRGTTYYYEIGSARQKLAAGSFVFGEVGSPSASDKAPSRSMLERLVDALRPATAPPAATPSAPASTEKSRAPPPTRTTWGRMGTLQDHFDRHGADFSATSPDDYAAQAWQFLQRARAGGLLMKWDVEESTLRVFDPASRAFAAYNRDGTTKTFFRPNNASYWDRQPGRSIQPSELPFR